MIQHSGMNSEDVEFRRVSNLRSVSEGIRSDLELYRIATIPRRSSSKSDRI
jgi:hypothetical protein